MKISCCEYNNLGHFLDGLPGFLGGLLLSWSRAEGVCVGGTSWSVVPEEGDDCMPPSCEEGCGGGAQICRGLESSRRGLLRSWNQQIITSLG